MTTLDEAGVNRRPAAGEVVKNARPSAATKRHGQRTHADLDEGSRRSVPPAIDNGRTTALQQVLAKKSAELIEALELRVISLEKALRRHEQTIQDLQTNVLPIDPKHVHAAAVAALEVAQRRLADEALLQAQDRVWAQDTQFELEDVDPQWSDAAVLEVNEAIADATIDGAHVIGLECHSSICRVEMNYAEPDAQAEVEMALARLSLNVSGGMLSNDDRAPNTSIRTYYLTRADAPVD